jgi:uncharacterized protein
VPPEPGEPRATPLVLALKVGVYAFFYLLAAILLSPLLTWVGGFFAGITISGFLGAALSNSLAMRIWERLHLADVGFHWNREAGWNLLLGLAGGIGSACLVLAPPLLLGIARVRAVPDAAADWTTFLFVTILLLFGATGEEMLFRGYGFQILLRSLGEWATIIPAAVLFAALHSGNPNATPLALVNTAGFGVLFGYALLRSGDLWLPIGLHFGWNFTLPVFGVNVSGFTMRVTNYALEWTAGPLISGGDYGPEASVLTSLVLFALFAYLWKAPVRRQRLPLLTPAEV